LEVEGMLNGNWELTPGQLNRNLSEYLRMLRRRIAAVVVAIVVIMALVVGFLILAAPRYTASSQIVFDSKVAANDVDLRPVLSGQPPDEAFILSELDVIRSRSLALRVIDKLRLGENPDFNESLRPAHFFSEMIRKHVPATWLRVWKGMQAGWAETLWPFPPPPDPEMHKERLVEKFQRSVSVSRNNRSRTINVSFTASTPQLAADALNMLTELYLVARMDDHLENAKRASTWLAEQIQELRDRAEQADKAVEKYRASHNLFEASNETLISKQIGELSSRLTEASIERRQAEADLIQVHRLLNGAGTIDASPQVMQSELIRKYREDELALERRDAQMTQEYGDRHPALIQLRAEKQPLEEKIRIEIARIATSLENQARMALDRENSIQASLQNVKSVMVEANADSIGLRALERQADASKVLLERMMGALLQTSAEENIKSHTPDARLISSAPPPRYPSFPPKLLLLLSGLLTSTALGVLLAFVLEHLDVSFHSAEEVEASCGLPILAQVPVVRHPSRYLLERPRSAYAASIRAIYTRVALISGERPPKVLLFTSAEAKEGKSTIALSVARQQALSGRRVVLVEVDFIRPCIAGMAGVSLGPGLKELLAGSADVADVIQRDTSAGAHIIVAGGGHTMNRDKPGDLGPVLASLRDIYDVVILDAPPVLGLVDTNILASVADATLMIVRWGKTRRQVFKYAVGDITKFGGRINAIILSQVDTRRQAHYSYGDSSIYTGEAAKSYVG
jgi:polysaccharide biosynthesis transport protein